MTPPAHDIKNVEGPINFTENAVKDGIIYKRGKRHNSLVTLMNLTLSTVCSLLEVSSEHKGTLIIFTLRAICSVQPL